MLSLNGNRSILKMSTQIRIDVRCTEYYELDLHCELPYEFTVDDIEDIVPNGYGEIALELTKASGKEFMKLARRDNLFSSNNWKEHTTEFMVLRFNTPTHWDFHEVYVHESKDGDLKVELLTHHEDMECYDVEHLVNDWEEEL